MLGRDHALSGALVFAALGPTLHVTGTHLAVGILLTAGAGVLPDIDHPDSTIAQSFGFLTEAFAWLVARLSGGHRHGTHSLFGIAAFTAGALWAGSFQLSGPRLEFHLGAGAIAAGQAAFSWHFVPAAIFLALLYSSALRAVHIGGHHGDLFGIAGALYTCYAGWDLASLPVGSWHIPMLAVVTALGCAAHIAGDELTHGGCPLLWPFSTREFHLLPRPLQITTAKLCETWIIFPVLIIALAAVVWHDTGHPVVVPHAAKLPAPAPPAFCQLRGTAYHWLVRSILIVSAFLISPGRSRAIILICAKRQLGACMSSGSKALRNRLVDGPQSMGQRLRSRRWEWFLSEFPDIESMSVIDLGGTAQAWLRAPVRPKSVHVVNLAAEHVEPAATWLRASQADACDLPAHIRDTTFDLVFSNSVLEHVGGHAQRMRFAEAVGKLANCHWVQTPYRYFPVEPHWLFPGLQFMPMALRARLSYRWPLVHTNAKSPAAALEAVMAVELVGRAQMGYYFPDSDIRAERVLGIPKSLVAIKRS